MPEVREDIKIISKKDLVMKQDIFSNRILNPLNEKYINRNRFSLGKYEAEVKDKKETSNEASLKNKFDIKAR